MMMVGMVQHRAGHDGLVDGDRVDHRDRLDHRNGLNDGHGLVLDDGGVHHVGMRVANHDRGSNDQSRSGSRSSDGDGHEAGDDDLRRIS